MVDSGGEEGDGGRGHAFGTLIPAVRKKRMGEMKGSNAPPGVENNFSLKVYRVRESQLPFPGSRGDSVELSREEEEGEVAMVVQS